MTWTAYSFRKHGSVLGAAVLAIASVTGATAETLGAFVTSNGWAVISDRSLGDCDAYGSPEFGVATDVIEDASHRLKLVKFDVRTTAALVPDLRAQAGDRVSVIFSAPSGSGLTVRSRRVIEAMAGGGDASYLQLAHTRESRGKTQFVLNDNAELMGVISGWEDDRSTARVAKSGYIALLLASYGHDFDLRRPARRIQDALVTIDCDWDAYGGGDTTAGEPGFNENTLSTFGAETWARAFTQLYQEAWSSENTTALNFVDQVYGANVDYFGKSFTKAGVMSDKTNFAERWDLRSYALREEALDIKCGATKCTIQGVNDYFTYSSALGRTSSGVASFSFDLDLRSLQISRENSSVLSRDGADPEGMFADWAQTTQNCNAGNDQACGRADYIERVLNAYDYCIVTRQPLGRLREIQLCN